MRNELTAVAMVVHALASAALAQPGGGPPPSPVVVEAVRMETVEQWREVTGELRAVRRALLASEEDGLVVEVVLQGPPGGQEGIYGSA